MASDQAVTAKDVMGAMLYVQRRGNDRLLLELEQSEPDLCEYLLEQVSALNRAIGELGARPNRARRLTRQIEQTALVLVFAQRNAHLRLWQEQHAGTPLGELIRPADGADEIGAEPSESEEHRNPPGSPQPPTE